jgi:transposase
VVGRRSCCCGNCFGIDINWFRWHAGHEPVACGRPQRRVTLKKAVWRPAGRAQLESLELACWSRRRRQDLLELLDQLTPKIQELTRALELEVEKRPVARRLVTHPGVGPLTALAFELVVGTPVAVASRSPAMWDWCRQRNPVAIGDGANHRGEE